SPQPAWCLPRPANCSLRPLRQILARAGSRGSLVDPVGEGPQRPGGRTEAAGELAALVGELADPHGRGLAQRRLIIVEDVVGVLERDPEREPVALELGDGLGPGTAGQGPERARGREQSPGLERVNLLEPTDLADVLALLEIERLAADHAVDPGMLGQDRDGVGHRGRRDPVGATDQHRERAGQQRVADQDRVGDPELDVDGWLPAALEGVVHRRQIVVDQRIGVDHLERAAGRKRVGDLASDRLAAGDGQQRAHALAAEQHRVAHALAQSTGVDFTGGLGQQAVERGVDGRLSLGEVVLQVKVAHRSRSLLWVLVLVGVVLFVGEVDDPIVAEQHLDSLLDRREQLLAFADQLDALLEARERLLERQLAGLELAHHLVEAAEQRLGRWTGNRRPTGGLAAGPGGLGLAGTSHRRAVYRRSPAPSTTLRPNCAPRQGLPSVLLRSGPRYSLPARWSVPAKSTTSTSSWASSMST